MTILKVGGTNLYVFLLLRLSNLRDRLIAPALLSGLAYCDQLKASTDDYFEKGTFYGQHTFVYYLSDRIRSHGWPGMFSHLFIRGRGYLPKVPSV